MIARLARYEDRCYLPRMRSRSVASVLLLVSLLAACSSAGSDPGTTTADTGHAVDTGSAADTTVDGDKADTTAAETPVDTGAPDATTSDTAPTDTGLVTKDTGVVKDGGTPGSCTTDADCRAYSSYCAGKDPCACLALRAGEKDPVCPGPSVSCFVEPCAGKKAICSGGTCAIASK